MSREQIIKIAMVICVVVLLCAVIITSTGMFGTNGINGYANAEKYTAGETEITAAVHHLDVNWTSGKVIVAYHPENTVKLEEKADRDLADDEKMQWWLDGDTLRIQFTKPGIRLNNPSKTLTLVLPEGMSFQNVSIQLTSGDMEVPSLKADKLDLGSTSGNISVTAEAEKVAVNSTSGALKIQLNGRTDDIKIGSTSGNVDLEAETAGNVAAGSTSGGISISLNEADQVKAGSTSGSIYVRLGKINALDLGATSGSITAALPEVPGFTAEIGTVSGKISYDIALTMDGDRYICGDGSAKVKIGTTSGNVRMEKADQ